MATLGLFLPDCVAAQQAPGPLPTQAVDRQRAVTCLTLAIAYEAAYEPRAGREAVAEVILNRLREPAYPKSVCGVVFAGSERRTGCQFSFTCDGSLDRRLPAWVMSSARDVAEAALDGRNAIHASGATHYHADYVTPYWASSLSTVAQIGRHIFYRPLGSRDQTPVARAVMLSAEPQIARLSRYNASFAGTGASTPPPPPVRDAAPVKAFAPWGLPLGTAGPD